MMKADIALVSVQLLDKGRGTVLSLTLSPPLSVSFLCRISYIDGIFGFIVLIDCIYICGKSFFGNTTHKKAEPIDDVL